MPSKYAMIFFGASNYILSVHVYILYQFVLQHWDEQHFPITHPGFKPKELLIGVRSTFTSTWLDMFCLLPTNLQMPNLELPVRVSIIQIVVIECDIQPPFYLTNYSGDSFQFGEHRILSRHPQLPTKYTNANIWKRQSYAQRPCWSKVRVPPFKPTNISNDHDKLKNKLRKYSWLADIPDFLTKTTDVNLWNRQSNSLIPYYTEFKKIIQSGHNNANDWNHQSCALSTYYNYFKSRSANI